MKEAVFHNHGNRLRELANDPEIIFRYTKHALGELRKDQLTKLDVESVLRKGSVIRVEQNRGEETWNVQGRDSDERNLEIVIVAYDREIEIKVITAWDTRQ